jgi:hypothetical protein
MSEKKVHTTLCHTDSNVCYDENKNLNAINMPICLSGDQREPGWWIQQLIKLGASTQIPNISPTYVVWDGKHCILHLDNYLPSFYSLLPSFFSSFLLPSFLPSSYLPFFLPFLLLPSLLPSSFLNSLLPSLLPSSFLPSLISSFLLLNDFVLAVS